MPKFEIVVRTADPRKHGKAALWQWELYKKGKVLPVRKGKTIGAQGRAYKAAQLAQMECEASKPRKSKRRPND